MSPAGLTKPAERYRYGPMTDGPPPLSYREFIVLIHELLVAVWGPEWGERFGPQAPPSHPVNNPYIKYRLLRRTPTQDISGNSEPRLRDEIQDAQDPGNSFAVYGQLFDCLIEFECIAPTPDQADELAERFEEFMLIYRPYLISRGVRKILFVEQDADRHDTSTKESSYGRPLVYLVRLDHVTAVPISILEAVSATVNLTASP